MTARIRWRGLLAALLLTATTIGLPVALATTAGNPLHAVHSLRAGQLSDTDMIAILAAVFWVAWLSFAIPVVVELAAAVTARITRHTARPVRLPMLGAQQHFARQLISAVLLLFPAATSGLTATTMSATHHVTAPAAWRASAASPTAQPTAVRHAGKADATRSYRIPDVGGMRSYWALAEHYLGDGARWREIWQLNEGRTHTDGTVMNTPRQLHAGWTVLLPPTAAPEDGDVAAGTHDVRIAAGDTLSGLAAADGIHDWQRAWALNADRTEPDHQRYTDPDLIRPGWTLTLPNTPAATDPHPVGTGDPNSAPPHGRAPRPAVAATPPPSNISPSPARPPTDGYPAPSNTTTTRAAATGQQQHRVPTVPLEIGLAALAAVTALDRARRIAQRRRRPGHRTLPPPPELVAVEAQLRRDARRAHPTIAAIELATALSGTHPVTVRTVTAHSDGAVDLTLTEPAPPPPPFHAIGDRWRLPAGADAFSFALNPDDLDDPCPALIPIGTNADSQILVNLAATGPVSITGKPAAVDARLLQIVKALAGAPWATRLHMHLPPRLADQLPAGERLIVDDARHPHPAAALAVSQGDEEPGWRTTPIHLYLGWEPDADLELLLTAAADPLHHLHVLGRDLPHAAETWTLEGDQLTVPGLDQPVTITVANPAGFATADLLHHTATAPDVPVGDPRLPDLAPPPPPAPPIDAAGGDTATVMGDTPKRLLLLGPVELTDTGRLRRNQTLNLLTFLAMHPRGVDRHQLLAALWPDQAPSSQTLRNRISETRALVDGAITDGPIWRLTDSFTTDWAQFTALAKGGIDEQRRALQLVRGRPFAGLDDADWIDLEGFRSEVEASIVDVALTVAEHDLDTANYSGALDAARAGLAASRYEERLHRAGIRAATAQGQHGIAKTLQHEMRTALDLDIEPDDQIQPETLALLTDLRSRRVAVGSTSEHSDLV